MPRIDLMAGTFVSNLSRVGLVALLFVIGMGAAAAIEPARFAAMYDDPAVFEHALAKESVAPPPAIALPESPFRTTSWQRT